MNMANLQIFITHSPNSDNYQVKRPYVQNVIAGTDFQKEPKRDGFVFDNAGENISSRNPSFCELTTIFWAWKNVTADYYGFCHYRRLLSFSKNSLGNRIDREWGVYPMSCLNENSLHKIGWGSESPDIDISKYDFLIGEHIKTYDLEAPSVRDHWCNAKVLLESDFDLFLTILDEKYPELSKTAKKYALGDDFYPCNMFIASRELFNEYCEKMFDVLFEFENRADFSRYSIEMKRVTGHLAERFTGIFYTHLKKRKELHLKELEVVQFKKTSPCRPLEPSLPSAKGIVFAANNAYAPYLGTCLFSLCENLDPATNCDIAIFNTDFNPDSKARFKAIAAPFPNVSLHFVDVTPWISGYSPKVKGIIDHVSIETFYRFLIMEIMQAYDQVLYLDSDMIVNCDITPLLATRLDSDLIGAVIDADYLAQLNNQDEYDNYGWTSSRFIYSKSVLGLSDPFAYFQAGMLLLNVSELKKTCILDDLMNMAQSGSYIYMDQDILNIVCQERVRFLDMRWNVMMDHHLGEGRANLIKRFSPADVAKNYFDSRSDPKIIHYAGPEKPWTDPECDFASVFWQYARKTSFYEIIIDRMAKSKPTTKPSRPLVARIKNRLRRIVKH